MNMKKACVFDLDGTLINSIFDIAAAVNTGLRQLNLPEHTVDDYYHMVGNGMVKLCQRAVPAQRQELAQPLLKLYQAEYLAHCCEKTIPYPGVPQLLQQLHNHGILTALITNKPQEQTDRVLAALLPDAAFDLVLGQSSRFPVKPNPASLRYVMEQLRLTPDEVLYSGDSDVDIQFAHAAGAQGAGCLWGFRGEAELTAAGADFLAAQPADLLPIALGVPGCK